MFPATLKCDTRFGKENIEVYIMPLKILFRRVRFYTTRTQITESSFEVGPEFRLQTLLEIGMVDKKEVPYEKTVVALVYVLRSMLLTEGHWGVNRAHILQAAD